MIDQGESVFLEMYITEYRVGVCVHVISLSVDVSVVENLYLGIQLHLIRSYTSILVEIKTRMGG